MFLFHWGKHEEKDIHYLIWLKQCWSGLGWSIMASLDQVSVGAILITTRRPVTLNTHTYTDTQQWLVGLLGFKQWMTAALGAANGLLCAQAAWLQAAPCWRGWHTAPRRRRRSQVLILISLLLPGALSQNTVAVKTLCHSEETQLSLPAASAAAASPGHSVALRCYGRFKM